MARRLLREGHDGIAQFRSKLRVTAGNNNVLFGIDDISYGMA